MPTYAGFYATTEDCRAWLRKNAPEIIQKHPHAGPRGVQLKANEYMMRNRLPDAFLLRTLPLPGPDRPDVTWALMLARRSSRRKTYLTPDPNQDRRLREMVEMEFGLKVSEWTVIWFSKHDPDMITEFLSPETVDSDDE